MPRSHPPLAFGRTLLAVSISCVCSPATSLQPMTSIEPTAVELDAFATTVVGAVQKLQLDDWRAGASAAPVIHVLGASAVEAAVDWSPLCRAGASVVLVGPQAIAVSEGGPDTDCVSVVKGLYSGALVRSTLGDGSAATTPDAVVLLNADLYMPYWRRTLAELLQLRRPVVMTMYCMFEGAEMERLFRWQEDEFTEEAFASCDAMVHQSFDGHAEGHTGAGGKGVAAGVGKVPPALMLWEFEENPHAHEAPRDCYSGQTHGVRNSYWMAFTGSPSAAVAGGG